MNQTPEHESQHGAEKCTQNYWAQEDHEQVATPDRDTVVYLDGVVRQQVAHHAAAVEGGDREKVEEEERNVDQDGQGTDQHKRLRRYLPGRSQGGNEGPKNNDVPVGDHLDVNGQNNKGDQHDQHVGNRTGQGSQVVVANDLSEVPCNNRGWLGPAHKHASKEAES